MAQTTNVATPSAAVEAMTPDFALAGALLGGTRAMRAAAKAYLPQWPKEEREAYEARLAVSVLFPAYRRTVSTLAAKPFSSAVTAKEGTPAQLVELLLDIDMQGRNLDRFAADVFEDTLGKGLAGILVDFPDASAAPATAAGIRTQAAERAAGLRPYWVNIKAEQVLGWRAELRAGVWHLNMLRLMESVEESDGEFATVMVQQVRVLEPGKWRTYRMQQVEGSAEKQWVLHRDGVTTIDFVPFVPCYGERIAFMVGRPPLIELAHLNVAHWQSSSDQQNILHVARVPILVAKNVQDTFNSTTNEVTPWELKIGAGAAVRINGGGQGLDCDLAYVEHGGQAITSGADDLKQLEDRMRQAGAELLVLGAGQKTRIEAAGDNEVALCALQRMTLAFEDALDQALAYTCAWLKIADAGGVDLFKDFGALSLDEASGQLLLDMAMAGKLSDETLHSEIKRRGIVSSDSTWGDEKDRIDSQGPALGSIGPGPGEGGAGGSGAA